MKNKIYYLSTCSTCKRILKEINAASMDFEMQDLKVLPLDEAQVAELYRLSKSYEDLFSRRSQQFRALNLHTMELDEPAYKHYLLAHYSFLKRPVIIYEGQIYIGSSKSVIESLKQALL